MLISNTNPTGSSSTWWFSALLSRWNVLKTVILYIVAKFYSWMLFLTPTCHSQGQPGIFRETPSHQIVELLKRSTKCLHDLLHIHHQGCPYFCREAYTPYLQSLISCISISSDYNGEVEVNLWGEAIWDARCMHSFEVHRSLTKPPQEQGIQMLVHNTLHMCWTGLYLWKNTIIR